ncbi:putative transposase, Ptta/En/Spm, plant [Sesbania bispinosa]|nr:putative transposase, Ptta/En/Spm, plant [Sesbania bispinosa]
MYFDPTIQTRRTQVPRNDDGGEGIIDEQLSIFNHPCRTIGRGRNRYLTDEELQIVETYVLVNCREVEPYLQKFEDFLRETNHNILEDDILKARDKDFSRWLKHQVSTGQVEDQMIREISYGPSKYVTCYNVLIVNGYKFHTKDYGQNKSTTNSGICVRGNIYGENDLDYYGIVEEILELSYLGNQNKHKSRLHSNEPFVLAEQAQQVYHTRYPQGGGRASGEWWAACKVRAKLFPIETLNDEDDGSNELVDIDYFQDDGSVRAQNLDIDDEAIPLFDAHAPMEEVNINDIHHSMDNLHDDQFIYENEDSEIDEFIDEDEEILIMPTRGRGRRRGSHTNTPHQPFQPSIDPPSLQHSPHSPGATSAIGLSASDGQPSSATRLVNGDQSTTLPTTVGPQPSVVPSSEDSHTEVDRRLVISVEDVSNPRRFVPSSLTRDIISEVISRMPYPADNWKSYCSDMKQMLFNDFKEKYHFSSNYDRTMAKTVWERTCMDRYPNYLAKARAAAFVRANSTNIADLKGHGPKGMRTEIWDGLVDIWMTPEWQKKSAAGKSNRASKLDSMEMELKRPVSYNEVYIKVHKKKDGDYVSNRAKDFVESYETAMSEKYGEDSSTHPAVDSEIWLHAASENKKGRVHDIGRSLDIGILGSIHASS